ncbi:MAG TPA: PIN domain-containing protein [Gammaproteobacteria bacterium]|nr:PIN domain-containing protein [Gammaproteobacteria bacterium]
MANFTAVYDACVLYPAPLRDLLVRLAATGSFRARWSADIHDEWIRNVLKNREDLTVEQLNRTRELMDNAVPDCLVTGYSKLIKGLELPDPNDRHVLAAAIKANAEVIVTFNLKDFPKEVLDEFEIFAQHPDDFIDSVYDLSPQAVISTARQQRGSLTNPAMTAEEFIAILQANQLTNTASHLEDAIDLI